MVAPDADNRIACANNCVLARDGRHTVLIDTGYGGKFSPLDRKFYVMEPGEPLLESLRALGVAPDEIDTRGLQPLALRSCLRRHAIRRAKTPRADLSACPPPGRPFGMGRRHRRKSRTDDRLSDGRHPAALRSRTDDGRRRWPRDCARAALPGDRRAHAGHMAMFFESGGQTAAYLGDICPSTAHLRRMWHLAYDTYPVDTRRCKPELLGEPPTRVGGSSGITIRAPSSVASLAIRSANSCRSNRRPAWLPMALSAAQ